MENLKPVIKWVGGKRRLVPDLLKYAPTKFNHYFEPFIGGGAFWLALKPNEFTISDANSDLINLYQVIKYEPDELIKLLKAHSQNNSKDYYLTLRALDRSDTFKKLTSVQKAARLMYMLTVDFNGLYRVNSKGQFNVPYGHYNHPDIVKADQIKTLSSYLNASHGQILAGDYQETIQETQAGDFVYFDPPYVPLSETENFTKYTKDGFTLFDQETLCDNFFNLANRGVYVMLSQSDTLLVRQLYQKAHIHTVSINRLISSKASTRKRVNELIITSY